MLGVIEAVHISIWDFVRVSLSEFVLIEFKQNLQTYEC